MTRNLDAGSDFAYVLAVAQDPGATDFDVLMAITNTYQEMIQSDIPKRADVIVNEIRTHKPDLIALQEVTTLRTGVYGQPPDTVVVDGLQSLLQALDKKGLHYAAIAVQPNADIALPAFDSNYNPISVGFTDYDVVLARTDLPLWKLKISNIEMKHFDTILPFTLRDQTIRFLRGWITMQVTMRQKSYKFVTTHLETFSMDIQAAQTDELINGPLVSDLPVILAGDLNSDAYQPSWDNGPAFQMLQAAGFEDVWGTLRRWNTGLTWPLFAEDPPGPAKLRQRIDLIMTRGNGLEDKSIIRTGLSQSPQGVWASDHAGVLEKFVVLP
jgi:endonuclease/exonuclease/phosphatase family metal-dependent hydrolase